MLLLLILMFLVLLLLLGCDVVVNVDVFGVILML